MTVIKLNEVAGITMQFLSFEEVRHIHECLTLDFADSPDPISPPGIREDGVLLGSAVSRQTFGFGEELKYPNYHGNAATLCYGVCNNHCFHNGNKRTALVALLCHLDKNGYTFAEHVTHDDLYKLMLRIASHDLTKERRKKNSIRDVDAEIAVLSEWIRKNTRSISKGERNITYRELRKILKQFGFEFDNPQGNFVDIVKFEEVTTGLFFKKTRTERRRVSHIAYPRDGAQIGRQLLRKVRQDCGLTEDKGYDSTLFYVSQTTPDVFIGQYRKTLRRLAKV